MEKLDFYNRLLTNTTSTNPQKTADLEEEVDIVIHKLKFIPEESRPSVLVLDQATFYEPKSSPQLTDTIS
ncbi:MAG: ABC transporter substrate-binding protein, partial [Sphingobacterium sp.]